MALPPFDNYLTPDQVDAFIGMALKKNTIVEKAKTIGMKKPKALIEKIGFDMGNPNGDMTAIGVHKMMALMAVIEEADKPSGPILEVCMKGNQAPITGEGNWIHPEMKVGCDSSKKDKPWFAWCEICGASWKMDAHAKMKGVIYATEPDGEVDFDQPFANEWLISVLKT